MIIQDRDFQQYLEIKYNSVPNGAPVEICCGGRHSETCPFEMFVMISGCGCAWEECSCGHSRDIQKCDFYRAVSE